MKTLDGEMIRLKAWMQTHFDFAGLKAAGFFKDIRKNEHVKQADKICKFFDLKSIYDWRKVCNGSLCDGVNCDGTCDGCKNYKVQIKFKPFKPDMPHILTAKQWLN